MERIEYFQTNSDLFGACDKNKNKMLLDNHRRLDVIYTECLSNIKEYENALRDYIMVYNKSKSVARGYNRTTMYYDYYPQDFDGIFSVSCNLYSIESWPLMSMANNYYKVEETRLQLLTKLSKLKLSIENCLERVKTIAKNVEKNYSDLDAYITSSNKTITKSRVLLKSQKVAKKIQDEMYKVLSLSYVPTLEQIANANIGLNKAKKQYDLISNASSKIIL